jgi:hypothetical protein
MRLEGEKRGIMVERSKVGNERPRKLLEIEVFMSKDCLEYSAVCTRLCEGANVEKAVLIGEKGNNGRKIESRR